MVMKPVLQMHNLSKTYGKSRVVNRFCLSVEKEHIYGLIGPNGAGKTTIMKMLAGLVQPEEGEIRLFGEERDLEKQRSRMSFMLEAPYLDGSMTAYENMQYIRYVRGVASQVRISEVLELVGLAGVGEKKVKNFSLGMKQRLGIGMALLPGPEIMILDEPVNGLDPEGIVDVRNLLKRLAEEEETTILISSHLLSELSELCTDFALINHGSLIETFSAGELETKCRSYLAIQTDDIERTVTVLEQKLGTSNYKVTKSGEIRLYEFLRELEKVSRTITGENLTLTKFVVEGENLEQYYMSKVGDKNE